MEILYCEKCGVKIPQHDVEADGLTLLTRNQVLCVKCAPAPVPGPQQKPSARGIPAVTDPKKSSRLATIDNRSTGKTSVLKQNQTTSGRPTAKAPPKMNLAIPIAIGSAVGVVAGLVLVLILHAKAPPAAGGATPPGTSTTAVALSEPQPEKKTSAPIEEPSKAAPKTQPEIKPVLPEAPKVEAGAMPAVKVDSPASAQPVVPVQPVQAAQPAQTANAAALLDTVWIEDALPPGAAPVAENDAWNWVSSNPAPFSGALAHQSTNFAGPHQHFFSNATVPLIATSEENLIAYVYLDPENTPTEIMLQWNAAASWWGHRAYWGTNEIAYGGDDGTASLKHIGDLPPAGQWVRLEVPPAAVDLTNIPITGMAFAASNGRATWDHVGKGPHRLPTPEEQNAALTPKKKLDDDGIIFNPQVVLRLQHFATKPQGAGGSIFFAGPGCLSKEFEIKAPFNAWAIKPAPKELAGMRATPAELLVALPEFLDAKKPEAIVLFGDQTPGRKVTDMERLDWEDAAHLCLRMGVVPILGIPGSGAKDENADLRSAMIAAAENEQIPAINLKAPGMLGVELKGLLKLIEIRVYERPEVKEEKADE